MSKCEPHPAYFRQRARYEALVQRPNERDTDFYNGIYDRWRNPVLTREHIPPEWRFDLDPASNPFFMERLGVNAVFNAGARERTLDSGDKAVLAFRREGGGQTLTAVYNFSEFPKHVQPVQGGRCRDLLTGRDYADGAFEIGAYQALWLLKA